MAGCGIVHKPQHCQHKPLTFQSWFLFAGFIDHNTSQSALDHDLSLQTSSVTSDCHPLPSYCRRLPFPASTPNRQTGLEHNLGAAAITGTRSKHLWKYRWIKPVSLLSGAFTDFLIFKSFYLSCFYDEEVTICLLFMEVKQNLCQFGGGDCRKVKIELFFRYFLTQGLFSCHILTLLCQLELIFLCFCWWCHLLLFIFWPEELK